MRSHRTDAVLLPPVTPVDTKRNGSPASEVAPVSPLMVAPVRGPRARAAVPAGPIAPSNLPSPVAPVGAAPVPVVPEVAPPADPRLVAPVPISAAAPRQTIDLDGPHTWPIAAPVIRRSLPTAPPAPAAAHAVPSAPPVPMTPRPAPVPPVAAAPVAPVAPAAVAAVAAPAQVAPVPAPPVQVITENWLMSCGCHVALPVGYPTSKKYGQIRHANCPQGLGWPTNGKSGAHLLRKV